MQNPLTADRLLSLVAAPIVWAAHFLASYLIVSFACAVGMGGARTAIVLVTLAALALIVFTAWSNFRKWRHAGRPATGDAGVGAFLALGSMMLCGVSAIALAWVVFPVAVLPTCA